jgi:beta-lactamase class D
MTVGLVGCAETPTRPPSAQTQSMSATITTSPNSEIRPELEKYFQGYPGAFVLYDLNRDHYIRYNPERCAERFLPASTFKIMNSLIGLETGIIPDEDFVIKWNGKMYDVSSWNQDQSLKTAFKNSVVWYFQELARRVGTENIQYYVDAAHYGNQDISGQIDSFWLDGGLRISADEQIEFLKQLYRGDLPFSKRSMDIVKEILVLEKTESSQLSGKTGSTQLNFLQESWFVGYLETNGDVYFFAANLESPASDGFANGNLAKTVSLDILQSLGLIP